MKILNLYAGLGGNRKHWPSEANITAVEKDEKIAAIYRGLFPNDTLVVGDAHEYLRENYREYDFIWTSPPCQTHTKMCKATRHKERRYPNMDLYQEILFLQHYFSGDWVVENVRPFYEPLIPPTCVVGRHLFWSSFYFLANDVPRPSGFINMSSKVGEKALQEWLGIHYDESIYYGNNHCPAQVLRNCVHPDLGESILRQSGCYG